jgi:hypothetical protein
MARKKNSLTTQGHRVMGALATFIAPKLAADETLQSSELEALCKSIAPGRYDRQIEGIVGTVKERFASRFAQDEDLMPLRKVLQALMPSDLALDMAQDAMDDEDGGEDGFHFKKGAKDKKKKKKDDEEDFDEDGDKDEDEDENEDEDEDFNEDSAAKQTNLNQSEEGDEDADEENQWVKSAKARNNDPLKESSVSKLVKRKAEDSAMDAAINQARTQGADLAFRRLASRYEAAEIVRPIVGEVNVFASDAASIYKLALDAKGADLVGVPKVAYKAVLQNILKTEKAAAAPKTTRFAQDSAVTKTLQEEFTNIPALA